jgi:2-oxoglutarate dehydrogenase E2 component (dihydrolipoamide succinyltransferase)
MASKIIVPEMGESVMGATVARWLKREGERVAAGEAVVELETEKVDLEVAAEKPGVLAEISRHEGEEVKIGEVLGLIEEGPQTAETARGQLTDGAGARTEHPPEAAEPPRGAVAAPARPGVAIAEPAPPSAPFKGEAQPQTPPVGVPKEMAAKVAPPEPARTTAEPAQVTDRVVREERVRMSRRRQTIARRLVEAQHTAAMLTTFNEIDLGAVMDIRTRHKDLFKERHGVGLGITSFFVKAAIPALKAFPRLNAEIQAEEIILKHYYDIGIAVGAAEGLVVPVLRDADRLSFAEIEQAIKGFAQKAEKSSLSLENLRGGTFTITNGGVFGSLMSTPILNPPQVGILGLHKIDDRPIALKGAVVIRPMMYVALSYDHRLVDGREAVQFLVRVKELIEHPADLLLEG